MEILKPNSPRLTELAHYVIARTSADQLGATKLNKILWFIDCVSYREFGYAISGLDNYTRRQFGPTPHHMPAVFRDMKDQGLIKEKQVQTTLGIRREFYATQEPDLDIFSKAEIDLINRVILDHITLTANEISDLSHDALWTRTDMEQPMSVPEGAFAPIPIDAETLDWATSEVARLKL